MAQTAGVYPMAIAGRVASERERCLGMTPCEREWRKKWLQDQILHDCDPDPQGVRDYWRERLNPIRRLYNFGDSRAFFLARKCAWIYFGALCITYYFKYNGNDWTKKGGWRVLQTRPMLLPGMEGFPFHPDRCQHTDYANRNFRKSPI